MSTQSESANRDSASSLAESLAKMSNLTSECSDSLLEIKEIANNLSGKVLKGWSENCEEKLVCYSKDSKGDKNEVKHWVATGIEYSTDNLSEVTAKVNSLKLYIEILKETFGNLDGTDEILEHLADQIKKYQKQINDVLRDDKIKKTALMGMVGKLAFNKYDAKSRNFIPKTKVSTDLENWDGDLKFVRQDNGTYLVIKVGKDGSEVPMGYTTKKGKNKYYKAAKKKVLSDLKEKDKSSKENNTSDSNSKSDSTSDDYVNSDDIKKVIKQKSGDDLFHPLLSDKEKDIVSKRVANMLKNNDKSKSDLKGCEYVYTVSQLRSGKKRVYVKVISKNGKATIANGYHNTKVEFNEDFDI